MSPWFPMALVGAVLVWIGFPTWAWFLLAESFILKWMVQDLLRDELDGWLTWAMIDPSKLDV